MKGLIIIVILLVVALLPIREDCGGKGTCRTGPIEMGGTVQSCIFYEVKPAILVLLNMVNITVPIVYSRGDECMEISK